MSWLMTDLSTEEPYCMEVTWKIHDFFSIPRKKNFHMVSPPFSLAEDDWRLEMYPNGKAFTNNKGYIDVCLTRMNFSAAQQRVRLTFYLKTRKRENFESNRINYLFNKNFNSCGVGSFIERRQVEEEYYFFLPRGILTVCCQIMVERTSDDSGASEGELPGANSPVVPVKTGASPRKQLDACSQTETPDTCKGQEDLSRTTTSFLTLQSDYKKLLETEEDADVRLKLSDKEFRAHKCILRARSSVFSAMFQHDMQEKNSGEVIIEDLDSESFPDFLQHMYAGSVDTLTEENVFNLYTAADKYEMADLKSECKSYLKNTLSVDTFCDVMILSLRYQEGELMQCATDFFRKNMAKIIVTVKWQAFSKEHNTAANELLIKAIVPAEEKELES